MWDPLRKNKKKKRFLSPLSLSHLHVGPEKTKGKKLYLPPDLTVSVIFGEPYVMAGGPVLPPPLLLARHAPPPAHRALPPARRNPPLSLSLSPAKERQGNLRRS
jgi:hypothetical protein